MTPLEEAHALLKAIRAAQKAFAETAPGEYAETEVQFRREAIYGMLIIARADAKNLVDEFQALAATEQKGEQ